MANYKNNYTSKLKKRILKEKKTSNKKFITNYKDIKKYFKYFFDEYPNLNLFFVGDFNCPQSHSVFNPWRKKEYLPVFVNQKTTLKRAT